MTIKRPKRRPKAPPTILILLLLSLSLLLGPASAGVAAARTSPVAHAAIAVYAVELHVTNNSSQTVRLSGHWSGDFSPSDPPAVPPGGTQTVTMEANPSSVSYIPPDHTFEWQYHVTTAASELVFGRFTITGTPGSTNAVSCEDTGESWPRVLFSCDMDAHGYHTTAHLTLTDAPYGLSVSDQHVEWNGKAPTFRASVPKSWGGEMKVLDDFAGKTQVIGTTPIVDGGATWQPQVNALAVGNHRIYAQVTTSKDTVRGSNVVGVSVSRARPEIRVEADRTTLTYGQSLVVSASTRSDVTGRMEFYAATKKGCDGSDDPGASCEYMGSAPVVDGVAKLTKPKTLPRPGAHELFASYGGDDHYSESTSNLLPVTVQRSPTPMSLDIDTHDGQNDSFEHPPSFIVRMPTGAAGTVVFFASRYVSGQPRNGCVDGDNGGDKPTPGCEVFGTAEIKDGVATLALRSEAVSAGIWVVHAFYWGDAAYDRGDSNTFQVGIARSTPSMQLRASSTDVTSAHPPALTLVMPRAAQGPVIFYDDIDRGCEGNTSAGAACVPLGGAKLLDGAAKLSAPDKELSPGRHFIHASFGGDDNFIASNSDVLTVNVR